MRFQVLGPLEVEADNGPVVLGGPKERLLLALLLTRPNQVVSVEALIRGLWGEQPPPTAAKTLQSHIKRLRRALEPGRARGVAGQVLVTRQPGYLLRVAPGALDATRFEELTAQAGRALADGAAPAAGPMLREALGLWRGQAFEEFLDIDFGAAESDRLAELRLVAQEDRIEADLRVGRHRELVAELEGLVHDYPLRERLWAQLLLALYRSGRQADALLAYQRARSILVEELGIDPGAELRRLHAAVLAQDPALDSPPRAEPGPARELPQALSVAGPAFVGRAAELAWLRAAWTGAADGRGGVVFVVGGPGMGKTRLAAELAREIHDQGGWVLYGRCTPEENGPLQLFAQALAGWGSALREVPGIERSPAAVGEGLAGLLTGQPDHAVLLVLDDLHLAPPSTLEALAGLAAAVSTQRLLVLSTYRDEAAAGEVTALAERLEPSGGARRRLVPLNRDEVATVLAIYGAEATAQEAAGSVLERTGGIPLLVHQAAGDWAQAQAAQQLEETARQIASSRSRLRVDHAKFTDDVVDLRELREHTQQVARLATGQDPAGEEPEEGPTAAVCPYKGLARFEASDTEFFFGRERLVAELITHLVGAGLVGVVGPSGSGKSSLVRAGLLPALADGALPGSERWRQVLVRPGEHPMAELSRVGARPGAPGDGGDDATVEGGNADDHTMPWWGAGERVLRTIAGAERLLLVVDQFEEVFTSCRDEGERAAFLAALTEGAWADRSVTIVVVVRADYYGHCAADPALAGLLAANHVLIGAMGADELRRAIELPARRAGLHLESGLSTAMIGEVAEEPGGLPLLSCALLESWQHRRGRTLTLAAYQQAGGVHGAVARLAERAWQQLDPDQQAVARRILLRLAGPGEGEAVVRRRVSLTEFTQSRDQHALAVVEALTDQRLLTKSQDGVEVAHEALLREWPRLRGWLEEDVQGRALHRHLITAAREWDQAGRDPGELYRGARLTGTLEWARDHDADLNALEREYLDASRAAAEQEVADARRRAEREARTSRRLRGLLAGLAVVLVLALVAGGFALTLRGRAERQTLVAQHQTVVAESRRLGAQALLQSDLDRSLLLAVEAMRLDDSVDTRSGLLTTLLRSPQALRVLRGDGNQLYRLTASPDGRTLAAVDIGGMGGGTYLWDTRTGRRLPSPDGRDVVAFSRDGRLLATVGIPAAGGTDLLLWDVARRTVVRRLLLPSQHPDIGESVFGAAFSPDGRILAAGTWRGSLIFWNVASGARLGPALRYPTKQGLAGNLAFAPDGARLFTSVQGGKTVVWDVTRRRPVRTIPLGGMIAVSGDGKTVALGQQDGSIILADAGTGRRRRVLTAHRAAVIGLAFSPDSATLASASGDRTAILWDVATGKARETLRGHAGSVTGVAFSPDGATLYTGSLDDSVIAWDLTGTRGLGRQLTRAASPVVGVAFSPHDPNLLALVRRDGPVTLWDVSKRVRVGDPLDATGGSANAVAFSPDGRTLAADADGTVVLFDVATGARVGRPLHPPYGPITMEFQSRDINGISFSPDGRLLATAGNDGSMVLWDLARRAPIGHPLRALREFPVTAVAFSPDGRTLASAVDNGTVVLTRVPDGTLLNTLTTYGGAGALAFSRDGKTLAVAGFDDRVRLFDPRTGAARAAWAAGGEGVVSMSFNLDGSILATSGNDGTMTLWDYGSAKKIGAPLTGPPSPAVTAFDPTGHTLAAAFQDGTVLLWDVNPASWLKRACTVAGRRLTQQEWRDFLPARPYQPSC
jgi:WD40 repeat protein/DNA-binding SARP family transcriptional activator